MKTVKIISILLPMIPLLEGRLDAQDAATLSVSAHMDIYRAGGYNDGRDGSAPAVFTFHAGPGQVLKFSSVSGSWTCSGGIPAYGPDGASTGSCYHAGGQAYQNPIGPFAGYAATDFVEALTGMFLEDGLPASPPPPTRFYVQDSSQGGMPTDALVFSPRIGQVFFIGDGLTGTGTGALQSFRVPPTATHLYLGYTDACVALNGVPGCYSDNVGSLIANLQLHRYVPDWVEPTLSSAPSARCCSGIAYDAAHHYTLLFGGGDSGQPNPNPQNDTWIWRNGWHKLSPTTSPSARNSTSLAYDPTTRTVVLFGGYDASGNYPNDTWTWDGVTWTQQFPPVSPPGRALDVTAMAYDAVTETVLLFGGWAPSLLGDTWEWNGRTKTWKQLFPSSSPSPRAAPLAYDPVTREIVLFGAGGSATLGDTWTWNGTTWTQRFPVASPSPRRTASMAFDASIGQVALFGGRDDTTGQVFNDTWLWNGNTWKQLNTHSQAGARDAAAMDFDPISNGLVLFGGWLECCTPLDDTWLLVPVPVP